MKLLEGKNILITGGSRGIGKSIVEVLFNSGANVGFTFSSSESAANEIAKNLNAKGAIYHQDEALGTAHAILCAKEALEGPVVVAFADTLFRADFTLDTKKDGIIWVQKVEDPRAYGVVKMNENDVITDFIEKPQEFVSDLAIIGIYFFKDGLKLCGELQYLIDNNIKEKGEFQLTNALENMKQKGAEFYPGKVDEWLDCGNPLAAVHANKRVLEYTANDESRKALKIENAQILEPCFIGANVQLKNCTIGPFVSIGNDTCITNSTIKNTIIQNNTIIVDADLEDSMIGNHVEYKGGKKRISIGDYSKIG